VVAGTAGQPGEWRRAANRDDWRECHDVSRQHGRTFFFASHLLPPRQRRSILAAYAWCRVADDIVDRAPTTGRNAAARALDAWEAQLRTPVDPIAVAFADARATYGIPDQPLHDLLTGIRMDLDPVQFATWEELRQYAYYVAGTIGLVSAPILGCRDPQALPHAVDLGIAMQLTNILRDVAEDARMGRLYLPIDDLARFGVDPDAVLAGRPNGRFCELMAFEIDRARALYASAQPGIRALSPPGRVTALASSQLYAKILDRIEAQGHDVFQGRAVVPTSSKVLAMPGVARAFFALYT